MTSKPELDLAAFKSAMEKATKGPWRHAVKARSGAHIVDNGLPEQRVIVGHNARMLADDLDFIALSHNVAPQLVSEIEELRAENMRLQMNLDANRKIRRYVSFVLAGDEEADPQLAADRIVAKVAALETAGDVVSVTLAAAHDAERCPGCRLKNCFTANVTAKALEKWRQARGGRP